MKKEKGKRNFKFQISNFKLRSGRRPLRVGFDFDGVLLYNPARIARLPVAIFKRLFFKKGELKFYFPKSPLEKAIWRLAHYTSIFVSPGLEEIKKLVTEGKIEAYIITGRYSFLKADFEKRLKNMKINNTFKAIYLNQKDEQPHFFKERMIKKLKLDVFVEDNWDIVDYLSRKSKSQIIWIYNILDRFIDYHPKEPYLKKVIARIKKEFIS